MNGIPEPSNALSETYPNRDTFEHPGTTALQRSKERLMLDMKAVVDDAQGLFKEAMDTSAESLAAMPDYLEDRLCAVKRKLHDARSAAEARARHGAKVTAIYIRENPWKSVALVSGASVFVGILLVIACIPGINKMRKSEK